MRTMLTVMAAAAAAATTMAAIAGDQVTSLPGWNGPLPSDQYSGYLNVGSGKFLHYWLQMSENTPATAPTVVWFNGGPGCSSMMGAMQEMGAFSAAQNSSTSPITLKSRPTRWNQQANMLFIEAPAGVGLSYATTPAGLVHNDTSTAVDNYHALQQFFAGFPELLSNDLYLAGESYAGVYVPTLAYQVVTHNDAGAQPKLPLKGIMVGNGCTGSEIGSCSNAGTLTRMEFLFGQGLYSPSTHALVTSACAENLTDKACVAALAQAHNEIGAVNIYDVIADCHTGGNGDLTDDDAARTTSARLDYTARPMTAVERQVMEAAGLGATADDDGPSHGPGPVECIPGGASEAWLNQAAVRTALHAKSEASIGKFTPCTNKITYTSTEPNEPRDIYPTLIKAQLRIMIFNGQRDACVPYLDNEQWTSGMGLGVKSAWHPWYRKDQVAGYAVVYEDNFSFVTLSRAGHMCPQFAPLDSYEMFTRYINEQPF